MIPERIKIGDIWYRIEWHDELVDGEQQLLGVVDHNDAVIKFRTNQPATVRNTVLHELLHCICHLMRNSMKEADVDRMATGVRMLFIDNPGLLFILEDEDHK